MKWFDLFGAVLLVEQGNGREFAAQGIRNLHGPVVMARWQLIGDGIQLVSETETGGVVNNTWT